MALNTVNTHLMRTLDFTPDELAANRKGSLTPTQQDDLKTLVASGTRIGLTVAAIVILIMIGVCIWAVLGSRGIVPAPDFFTGETTPLIVGVMAVVLVFYVIMILVSTSQARRMGSGKASVRPITGKIKIRTLHMYGHSAASAVAGIAGASTTSYIVHVGKEKIYSTDDRVVDAFQDGITYRVYVVGRKQGSIIVSAEAMNAS